VDTCASFQEAVVDTLVHKTRRAAERTRAGCLVVCGGVACNSRLRERFEREARGLGIRLIVPRPRYCTDNAVMVASAGRHRFLLGSRAGMDLKAVPTWPLEETGEGPPLC
jgi:N6-L-threonylcarbamoyladenine synthase